MRWLESITDSMDTNLSKLQESVKDRGAWCAEVPGAAKSWIQLHIWTTHHSSSTWLIPVEFNHYQLTQVHFPIFPPSTLSSLAGSHFQCSHTLRSRGDNWTSSKTQYLHKLFGLFPMGNLFVLHLFFIHSTIYLNQYEPTDIYFTFWVIIVVQPPSCVRLFATPWTAACQASLSLTISWNLPKFTSIASVMPSSHLILWCPLLLSLIFG